MPHRPAESPGHNLHSRPPSTPSHLGPHTFPSTCPPLTGSDVMPRVSSAYRGAALVIGIGGGFALVGTVPVAVTLGLGIRTSATVIGVGFIGFGIMLILPGKMVSNKTCAHTPRCSDCKQ